ncbi:hypothetical protein [Rhizobium etli]|uniref:hypothetical protein n=1 Tax=Rhizobium etli TaxID=29449 RepID=UPI0003839155|nr:hypothetical protein [Rhizobium etli]AGS22014.1 hypothetical protein REMIM1_CH02230 [Rhizobium etli bv. mimosae str. Mim1]
MRIKFALAASLFAVSLAGAAFAQPTYSDDYTNDSDGFAPSKMAPPAAVHYSNNHKAPAYSSDYTNDSDGFAPTAMAGPAVDKTATASIKPLPPCHSMVGPRGSHTKGADSGASRSEACRATH